MPDDTANPTPSPERRFDIGLVMAGAISAGAYTAGVIDFLIDALDRWEEEKAWARANAGTLRARECPMHEVAIKVMAGASAGGMTAGLAAGLLAMDFDSVTTQPDPDAPAAPVNNNLYRSWVNTIDITPLLRTDDIDQDASMPVQSVLDSTILRTIADNAFAFEEPARTKRRPYVADPLHVHLTVTNLRGVPYAPKFANWPKLLQYEMIQHADNMHFILTANPTTFPDAFRLDPQSFSDKASWGVLQTSALATGAFPVGLAPRLLSRPPSQYEARQWHIPGPVEKNGVQVCESWETIPPNWPAIDQAVKEAAAAGKTFSYDFLCVDGGVMNNEPLDLARRVLTGPDGREATEGSLATSAVIMVLPFPNVDPFEAAYDGTTTLAGLLSTTFNSLIQQARFKPQEMVMADDPSVYSRFLIVPRRGFRADGTLEPNTIACGSLGGFGGFLSRSFREHDYQLGRRNCQWFLKQYFVLPSEGDKKNPLFDQWTPEAREKHQVKKAGWGGSGAPDPANPPKVLPVLPIIPLIGTAAVDIPPTRWPRYTDEDFDALRPQVNTRLNAVMTALVNQNVEGWLWGPLARAALKSALWFQSGNMLKKIMDTIRTDLVKRGLMTD